MLTISIFISAWIVVGCISMYVLCHLYHYVEELVLLRSEVVNSVLAGAVLGWFALGMLVFMLTIAVGMATFDCANNWVKRKMGKDTAVTNIFSYLERKEK